MIMVRFVHNIHFCKYLFGHSILEEKDAIYTIHM